MPETAKREGALENIRTELLAISSTSTDYNYSMDKAERIGGPFYEYIDESIDTQCFVEPGETTHGRETQDGKYISTMEVFVTGVRKYETGYTHPANRLDDQPSTVRSKLYRDMVKKLLVNWTRGSYARDTRLTNDGELLSEDVPILEGRVIHELRLEVDYEWDEDTP